MGRTSFPFVKMALFVALNGIDFLLTAHLLKLGGGEVWETNPLASRFHSDHGLLGMAAFKGLTTSIASTVIVLLFIRRPVVAHRLLTFGCLVVMTVVSYSTYLVRSLHQEAEIAQAEILALANMGEHPMYRGITTYREVTDAASRDLRRGTVTLAEATDALASTPKAHDEAWLNLLHRLHPGLTDQQCLTANLIVNAVASMADNAEVGSFACRLETEFFNLYGIETPTKYKPPLAEIDVNSPPDDADVFPLAISLHDYEDAVR